MNEILNLIESVSEVFSSYSYLCKTCDSRFDLYVEFLGVKFPTLGFDVLQNAHNCSACNGFLLKLDITELATAMQPLCD